MIHTIEFIFSLVSLMILTSAWILICSSISYYIKKYFRIGLSRQNIGAYALIAGLIFEITLASISLVLSIVFPHPGHGSKNLILSGLEKGKNISVLISPIGSFLGAALGAKMKKPLWKRF